MLKASSSPLHLKIPHYMYPVNKIKVHIAGPQYVVWGSCASLSGWEVLGDCSEKEPFLLWKVI